ncbi:Six-hairpin glycosidase [Peniophora sp. CONT]|nr:Six-hairpin glycosidase [Peniophora sp. CONT]
MRLLSATVASTVLLLAHAVDASIRFEGHHRFSARRTLRKRSSTVTSTINTGPVKSQAIALASHSWELGTLTEALIEFDSPALSVFGTGSVSACKASIDSEVYTIAANVMNSRSANSATLIGGDGAAGDPASLGPALLLVNQVLNNSSYANALELQLNHLLNDVPRDSATGGISQREDMVQFWADFVSMAPPFIAAYGLSLGDTTDGYNLLIEAHKQCKAYRTVLLDTSVSLWRHIMLGTWTLPQHWATGNGWAAYGMMRVLATLAKSPQSDQLSSQKTDLANWVGEILTGAYNYQHSNGTLYNYIDVSAPDTFPDSAGTALIAAATYRLAKYTGDSKFISKAELAYACVSKSIISTTGILKNVVDPETFSGPLPQGTGSPEAESFVLILEAARSAYYG